MSSLFLLALAASTQTTALGTVVGHYEAVTETEYNITLIIEPNGHARFEFVTWEADGSAPEQQEKLSGKWSRSGNTLSVQLASGKLAIYSVVPCLSHEEFGQTGCSQGLSLVKTNLADRYGLKRFGLWNSASLRRGVQQTSRSRRTTPPPLNSSVRPTFDTPSYPSDAEVKGR